MAIEWRITNVEPSPQRGRELVHTEWCVTYQKKSIRRVGSRVVLDHAGAPVEDTEEAAEVIFVRAFEVDEEWTDDQVREEIEKARAEIERSVKKPTDKPRRPNLIGEKSR